MAVPTLFSIPGLLEVTPGVPDANATVSARPSAYVRHEDGTVIEPNPIVVSTAADGTFTLPIMATDDPDWSPNGWTYEITIRPNSGVLPRLKWSVSVPIAQAPGLTFGELVPAVSGGTGTLYALASHTHSGFVTPSDLDAYATDAEVAAGLANKANVLHGHTAGQISGLAPVATSGAYSDLVGAPAPVDISGKVDKSTLTAKGDLFIATASGVITRLPTGGDNQVLTADSAQPTGARWGNVAAGNSVNIISTRRISSGYVSSGNLTPQNTSNAWAILNSSPVFMISAAAGDEVTFNWAGLIQGNSNTFYDPAVIVSGAAVRYASSGTSTPAVEGDPSLLADTNFQKHSGSFTFTAQAGDISGGNVTIAFAVKSTGIGTLYASTAYPLRWRLTSEKNTVGNSTGTINGNLTITGTAVAGAAQLTEFGADPSAPSANTSMLYSRNGHSYLRAPDGGIAPAEAGGGHLLSGTFGEETISREFVTSNNLSTLTGRMQLTFFTARRTETVTRLWTCSGQVAASGLTYAALGLYMIDAAGAGTLVAQTNSDTTLYALQNTGYPRILTTPYNKIAGMRYAVGVLQVGTTIASLLGQSISNTFIPRGLTPMMCGRIDGLSAIPSSFVVGDIVDSGNRIFGYIYP